MLNRRTFLKTGALSAAGLATRAQSLLAAPYDPLARVPRPTNPIRVQGVVRAQGRGVGRVAVSDGLQVVDSDADGRFELITSADRGFVWVRVPAGYEVPTNPSGTARFYERIDASRSEMSVAYDLSPLEVSDE
ncbi:MAG: hypothetical protein F4Z33_05425, partial [Gemmatimonadales bacterium]|nr:hypothetical protein [Gemmatimonadales bacterium]